MGVSENRGTLFWGPYVIIKTLVSRVLYQGPLFSEPHMFLNHMLSYPNKTACHQVLRGLLQALHYIAPEIGCDICSADMMAERKVAPNPEP